MAPFLPPAGWYPDPDGSAGLRYWDGQRWTNQRWAQTEPQWPAHPVPFPPPRMGPSALSRHKSGMVVGVAAAVILLVVLIAIVVTNVRDKASYRAGHAVGDSFGRTSMTLGGRWGLSDSQIRKSCRNLANSAANSDVYYYANGQIRGSDVHIDDFTDGCVDGARSALGR